MVWIGKHGLSLRKNIQKKLTKFIWREGDIVAKKMFVSLAYGSHLPCLIKAVEKTGGDILEFGTGIFSTPYLRYVAMLQDRLLVSVENFKPWYDFMLKYYENSAYHEMVFVENYADFDIGIPVRLNGQRDRWGIVLIDQTPDSSRAEEIIRLKDKAEYIVIHDSNPSNDRVTKYSTIYPHFKYKTDWHGDKNRATVLSNFNDLKDFWK